MIVCSTFSIPTLLSLFSRLATRDSEPSKRCSPRVASVGATPAVMAVTLTVAVRMQRRPVRDYQFAQTSTELSVRLNRNNICLLTGLLTYNGYTFAVNSSRNPGSRYAV